MTREYKEVTNERGDVAITYEENGYFISFPKDETNADYQAYLKRDEPQVELSTEISTGAN